MPTLAPYAADPAHSRGRLHAEPEAAERSVFQRDRDRVVHSTAFRRLQYKTQVFVYHEGDHFRTRLTHSLEVAQIARGTARALGLDEDLAEVLALAHDLGHTPFGHAGEDALNAGMAAFGGFAHNDQTVRILTRLERRYLAFDGLNLTVETIEGVLKHNGPVAAPSPLVAETAQAYGIDLGLQPSVEAQVAALADDIAYNNHDIDDGLRAGLFQVEDLAELPLVGPVFRELGGATRDGEPTRLRHEAIRRLINAMVTDLLAETRARLARFRPDSSDSVRAMPVPVAAFSDAMQAHDRALKAFLFERMYRHWRVNRMTSKARRVVRELFDRLLAEPQLLPPEWRRQARAAAEPVTARTVADYIAGMTDRFALEEHRRLTDPYSRP